ncbi:MAG: peptidase C14 [Bosea sp.]|uniref:caspase family protein n=1 Tax=Bosea sp. (in: a-proteobacteria) TaxID=1871050 RepID=UPI002392934F|nr:peptidase C14 [Bosea sp. (in: a-proteobacteria)]MCP4738412.1 peptidase C14 [Bosea sp. (in: a-proteobacteria)]
MPGSQLLRLVLATLFVAIGFSHVQAQPLEKRIALVIGNGAYQAGTLASPANDAGLVAQTLQAAGFDVVGARDLDMATFRASLREFIDKANGSGPDTVAFVYFAGYGLQFEGENYLVPVDARIARDSDVPLEAIRLSDLVKPLAGLPLKARIIVLDAARQNDFARAGQPLAGGLALAQPDAGTLLAFNAAPGTIAPDAKEGYGAYATALSEMIKEGGLKLDDLFERVRLRVDGLTQGAELTWHVSRVEAPFLFFERAQGAPVEAERFSELRSRPIREFDPRQAYLAAVARDSMRGYQDFLAAYPDDPLARRVRAIIAARREATTWRESALADTREGYWSYLRRYPRGPHAYDARRRLAHLAAELEPPAAFAMLSYDVPPPPPEEVVYIERPVVYLADPVYELPPPPPVPVIYLPPRPAYFVELPPPPPPVEAYVLPVPVYHPVASWVERPRYVAPPPENVVSVNIHNTVVIDQSRQTVVVTTPGGQQLPPASAGLPDVPQPAPGQPAPSASHLGMAAAAAAAVAALPAAAALRAASQRPKPNGLQGASAPAAGAGQAQPVIPQVPGQPPMQAPSTQQAHPQQPPGNAAPALRPGQPPVQGAQPLPQPNQPGLATGDKGHAVPPVPGAAKPSLAAPGAPPAGANGPASAARPVQPATQGAQPLPQPNQPGLATGGKGQAAPPAPGAAKPALAAPGTPPAGANGPASVARPAQPSPQSAQPLPQPHQPGPANNGKGNAAAAPSTPRGPGSIDAAQQQRAQQAAQQQRTQQQAAQAARDQQMRAQQQAAAQQRQAQQAAQQQRAQQQAQQAARDQQMRAQQQAAAQQRQAQQAAQQQRAQQQAAQAAREQQMRAQQQAAQQHQMMQMQQQRAQQQAAQQQQRAAQAAAQQRQMMQQRQAAPHPQGGPHGPRRPDCGNPGQPPCR